jgi:hypothetical protein
MQNGPRTGGHFRSGILRASFTHSSLRSAQSGFLEQIQRGVDLCQLAFDFIALVRAGVLLQPLLQLLLSRQQFCNGCHRTIILYILADSTRDARFGSGRVDEAEQSRLSLW